ncbi:Rho-binding antiterminator [Motilimonas cestriensis]|uniref:Rho-binding antiterminator n=1 Tax=Motilimonas cestriensis TaxID=2742685 RepID=A0ABS8W5R8_9GAMM|nr:Rho-binding antiterminator [Motilimonas cestriensis]MCE2593878.1 Rho-binding antiterminator [Motilimonas cestriensis]
MSDLNPYQPIACDKYDYLELACLKQQPLHLVLIDQSCHLVVPHTLRIKSDRGEWLETEENGHPQAFRLDSISKFKLAEAQPQQDWINLAPCKND